MTTGQRIKAARENAGMTQAVLAAKLNIPYQSIGQWERDLRNPKIETLQRLADALNVDINWLRNGYTLEESTQAMKNRVAQRFAEVEFMKRIMDGALSLNVEGKQKIAEYTDDLVSSKRYPRPENSDSLKGVTVRVYGDGPAGSFAPNSEPIKGVDTSDNESPSEMP